MSPFRTSFHSAEANPVDVLVIKSKGEVFDIDFMKAKKKSISTWSEGSPLTLRGCKKDIKSEIDQETIIRISKPCITSEHREQGIPAASHCKTQNAPFYFPSASSMNKTLPTLKDHSNQSVRIFIGGSFRSNDETYYSRGLECEW